MRTTLPKVSTSRKIMQEDCKDLNILRHITRAIPVIFSLTHFLHNNAAFMFKGDRGRVGMKREYFQVVRGLPNNKPRCNICIVLLTTMPQQVLLWCKKRRAAMMREYLCFPRISRLWRHCRENALWGTNWWCQINVHVIVLESQANT